MLRRARIGSTPDLVRIGAALARPGMDTRLWVSLALVSGESKVDPEHGVFVDLQLFPTGESVTARVPGPYVGKSFGFHGGTLHKDDEVVVVIPSGDAGDGAVVVARLWGAVDTPPQEAIDHPEELLEVVEKDRNYRVITSGAGKVYAKSDDTVTVDAPKVRLGKEDATEQVILGTTFRTAESTKHSSEQTAYGQIAAAAAQISAAAAFHLIPVAGPILGSPLLTAAGAQLAAAAVALTSASATFESTGAANQSFLSNVTNTAR